MKTHKLLLWFFVSTAFAIACQKERSYENGKGTPSDGSLQSGVTGDCLGSVLAGTYKRDTVLNSTNYVDVKVDVNTSGSYVIGTDTINGFFFRATGTFSTTGVNTVRLQGNGKPLAAGTNIFTVTYDSTQCTFPVTTLGSGGTSVFTLAGAPSNCTPGTTQGTYTAGVPTDSTNTATIQVNVTTVGTYSIVTSTVDGITFSASGTFSATGTQTIILKASGTPTAGSSGSYTVPVTAGSSSCTITVTVGGGGPATFSLVGSPGTCTSASVQGSYMVSTPLTASNKVTLQVNVTGIGSYSITTTAVNGITFTGSGSFTATGAQTVVLTGSGTPTATGLVTIPVTAGSSNCSFTLTVVPIDYYPRTTNSNWSYEFDDVPTDTLLRKVIAPTKSALGNTYNIFMETSDASGGFDSSGYFRRSGGDYYQYLDIGFVFDLDNSVWGENIFLKDNVAAGTTWRSASFSGSYTYSDSSGTHTVPIVVRIKETIQQKDVTVSVNGTSYPFTIVVKEEYEYSFDAGATWNVSDVYSIYNYARNIGLIKWEAFDTMGTIIKQEITRSQVF
jgi:hypothetical protein